MVRCHSQVSQSDVTARRHILWDSRVSQGVPKRPWLLHGKGARCGQGEWFGKGVQELLMGVKWFALSNKE